MTRVILTLLLIIQLMFCTNALLNEGFIFFNIYIWGTVALLSLYTAIRAFLEHHGDETEIFNNYFALTLIAISLTSIGYIIYLIFFKPYYL